MTYVSRVSGATCGIRAQSHRSRNLFTFIPRGLLAFALVLVQGSSMSRGVESNAPPSSPSQLEGTNVQQLLRACLQIQERLQATQLAVEQNRRETRDAAERNTAALSNGLQILQEGLSAQRTRDLAAIQRSNNVVLVVAGTFVAMGFVTMLLVTYFQWRMSKGLAEISAVLPAALGLGTSSAPAALASAEQSNSRLLGALDLLDKRIHEVKKAISSGGNGASPAVPDRTPAAADPEPSQANEHARISWLLNRAYSMMNVEDAEAAVACCDEVLSLDPNHAEALVKKGAALERLHKLNEAIECYDRAIALDGSMTLAYLHKGGLYNRLERFKEALECYGKALRTHNQQGS